MKNRILAALLALAAPTLVACPKSQDAAKPQLGADADPVARGQEAKAAGKLDEAMADYREALARDPHRLDAWRLLVQIYAESSRLSEITRELQQRSAAAPQDDALHYALGLALFGQAQTAGTDALAEFQKAQQLRPTEAEYPFRLGVAQFELEHYTEALPSLRKAVELAPQQAKYRVPLGLSLARLGQRDAAMEQFRALLTLSPTGHDVQLAQKALERLDDPLRDIPKAEEEKVKQGMDWLQRADAPQQAIDAFLDVLDRYPDLAPVHTLIGLAYERLDDVGPAIEHLRRAIELRPNDALPYLYLGELYVTKQKPEPATNYLHLALQRNPLLDRAYARLGELAIARGDAAGALENFKALAVLRPDDPGAQKLLAQGYALNGQTERAESELRTLVEKNPKDLEAQLQLGYLYAASSKRSQGAERERQTKLAQAAFQKVLDAQPENVAASRALQELQASKP